MRFPALEEGLFLERLNRFACRVQRRGGEETAHMANSGRLREVLVAGCRVLLVPRPVRLADSDTSFGGPGTKAPAASPIARERSGRPIFRSLSASPRRRTASGLVLASLGGAWVSVDARLPPALVAEAVLQGRLAPFRGYHRVRREVPLGDRRIDLLLEDGVPCYVEVKSVTLVQDGVGRFPDAPTLRGRHHVEALAATLRQAHRHGVRQVGQGTAVGPGLRAAIAFVVQRGDAQAFSPNDATDPAFGHALRRALGQGVEAHAFRCRVTPQEIEIEAEIPMLL